MTSTIDTLKQLSALDYITPLREGGSLPAVIRADDGQLYAMKFIGAGQGARTLIAELIAGELARELGFNVPEIALLHLDDDFGRTEPDPEIQDILRASSGINFGLKFLSQAVAFSIAAAGEPSPEFASRLVWFDAFVTNVDRSPRNVNLLVHKDKTWLIDHGAALYFHHNWQDHVQQAKTPFSMIKDHVLLPFATRLDDAEQQLKPLLGSALFEKIVDQVPEQWLMSSARFANTQEQRAAYVEYLTQRLDNSHVFVKEANRVRAQLV